VDAQRTARASQRVGTVVTVPESIGAAANRRRIEQGAGRHLERRPESGGTATLPDDVLRGQSLRIQLFYAIGVIVWSINLVMDISLAPNGNRGPYRLMEYDFVKVLDFGLVKLDNRRGASGLLTDTSRHQTGEHLRLPVRRKYATQPSAYTSARWSALASPRIASGAM
jgi:hypothetical protein